MQCQHIHRNGNLCRCSATASHGFCCHHGPETHGLSVSHPDAPMPTSRDLLRRLQIALAIVIGDLASGPDPDLATIRRATATLHRCTTEVSVTLGLMSARRAREKAIARTSPKIAPPAGL